MVEEVEVGCVFTSYMRGKKLVLQIEPTDEGGVVTYTNIDDPKGHMGYIKICNMVPAGKLTIEEMLTSINPLIRKLGEERARYEPRHQNSITS